MGDPDILKDLLDEQLAYYRLSAREMDAGVRRVLEVDDSEYAEHTRIATTEAVQWLHAGVAGMDRLEIAAGTGLYTEKLAACASRLTAMDASPESLGINRAHAEEHGDEIDFICDDVFSWSPPRRYEVVVFTFWLSHVPHALFDAFWSPGGHLLKSESPAASVRRGGCQGERPPRQRDGDDE